MTLIKDGIQSDLVRDGWELESAVARQQQFPSFTIPNEEERKHLQPGKRVQLLVLFEETNEGEDQADTVEAEEEPLIQCERLWVTIEQVEATAYIGILESEPRSSTVLAAGDRIRFAPEHIATILITRDDPRHPDFGQAPPTRMQE